MNVLFSYYMCTYIFCHIKFYLLDIYVDANHQFYQTASIELAASECCYYFIKLLSFIS